MTSATVVHTTRCGREITFKHIPVVFDANGIAWAFAPGNTIVHDFLSRPHEVFGERVFIEVEIKGENHARG